jgi:hypothetical protein
VKQTCVRAGQRLSGSFGLRQTRMPRCDAPSGMDVVSAISPIKLMLIRAIHNVSLSCVYKNFIKIHAHHLETVIRDRAFYSRANCAPALDEAQNRSSD